MKIALVRPSIADPASACGRAGGPRRSAAIVMLLSFAMLDLLPANAVAAHRAGQARHWAAGATRSSETSRGFAGIGAQVIPPLDRPARPAATDPPPVPPVTDHNG